MKKKKRRKLHKKENPFSKRRNISREDRIPVHERKIGGAEARPSPSLHRSTLLAFKFVTSKKPRTYAYRIREWRVLRAQVTCVRECVPRKKGPRKKRRRREREEEKKERGEKRSWNRPLLTIIIIETSDPTRQPRTSETCLSSSSADRSRGHAHALFRYARFPV